MARTILLMLAVFVQAYAADEHDRTRTWGGLRFGMSIEDVKAYLGNRLTFRLDPTNPSKVAGDIAAVKAGEHEGKGSVLFNKDGRLITVGLDFSLIETGCFSSNRSEADKLLRIKAIGNALVEKYGAPSMEIEPWPRSEVLIRHFAYKSLGALTGVRLWKTPGQTIQATLDVMCDSVFLVVLYKAEDVEAAPEL